MELSMKFYCVSDNIDTQMGMRLAGIEGTVVHEAEQVKRALQKACNNSEIGVVLVSEKLVKLCPDIVYDIKLHTKIPLIVEIPDRHGTANIADNISRYVRDAVGIKI